MNIDVISASRIRAARFIRVERRPAQKALLQESLTMLEGIFGVIKLMFAVSSKRTDIAAEDLVAKPAEVPVKTGLRTRRTCNGLVPDLIENGPVTRRLLIHTQLLRFKNGQASRLTKWIVTLLSTRSNIPDTFFKIKGRHALI